MLKEIEPVNFCPYTTNFDVIKEYIIKNKIPITDERIPDMMCSFDGGDSYSILSGIYFLFTNNRITYIGISTNVVHRLNTHNKGIKNFTHYFILPLQLNITKEKWLESEFILEYNPKDNHVLPKGPYFTIKRISKMFGLKEEHIEKYIRNDVLNWYLYNNMTYIDFRDIEILIENEIL